MADKHGAGQRIEVFTEVMKSIDKADERNGIECRGFSRGEAAEVSMAFVVASGPYARLLLEAYKALVEAVDSYKGGGANG